MGSNPDYSENNNYFMSVTSTQRPKQTTEVHEYNKNAGESFFKNHDWIANRGTGKLNRDLSISHISLEKFLGLKITIERIDSFSTQRSTLKITGDDSRIYTIPKTLVYVNFPTKDVKSVIIEIINTLYEQKKAPLAIKNTEEQIHKKALAIVADDFSIVYELNDTVFLKLISYMETISTIRFRKTKNLPLVSIDNIALMTRFCEEENVSQTALLKLISEIKG